MKTNITSKTKVSASEFEYDECNGYNYLWQLVNLGSIIPAFKGMQIVKIGFAKRTYKSGLAHGVESRVKNTLYDIERKMGIERGQLKAKIHLVKDGDYDTTQSAESFFHSRNKDWCIKSLLHGFTLGLYMGQEWEWKKGLTIGGASEFYNMPVKLAKAKFYNAWRESNREIGLASVLAARARGQHGYPVANSGKGDEEPSIESRETRMTKDKPKYWHEVTL
ncbi:MAG TPA: hypothetical protein EYQ21_01125 [Flavobacteriales bacterium]|jgi:hypothetical protein|nr:hypothetical protein [Flavobacteriales bacterium]